MIHPTRNPKMAYLSNPSESLGLSLYSICIYDIYIYGHKIKTYIYIFIINQDGHKIKTYIYITYIFIYHIYIYKHIYNESRWT